MHTVGPRSSLGWEQPTDSPLDSMAPKGVPVQRWVYLSACNAVQKAPLKSREWGKQPGKEARK